MNFTFRIPTQYPNNTPVLIPDASLCLENVARASRKDGTTVRGK